MSVDEAHRRLYRKLEEILGTEEAGTLIDDLSQGAVTRGDLHNELGILRAELRTEILGVKADLLQQMNEQTKTLFRTFVVTNATLVFAVAGLAFGAARLA